MPKAKKEKPQPEQPEVNRKNAGLRSVDEVDLSKIPLGLQELALNQIFLSENNPRKKFSESSMKDLIQSVKLHGILQPVLVRPIEFNANTNVWTFELIAGERRLRAARESNLPLIPAISKLLTDEEAAEVQILENLQREDVHPLDEAFGFKRLLSFKNYNVKTISAKLGKSESFILKRLKLTELIADFYNMFYKDEITLGHALHISRLQPEQQEKLFKIFNENLTVADTKKMIENNFHLYLGKSVFSKTDAKLCAEAGACTTCPKRTGFNTELFEEYVDSDDRCTDPECYNSKVLAHIEKRIAKANKKGETLYKIGEYSSSSEDVIPSIKITEADSWHDKELLAKCEEAGLVKNGIQVETDRWSRNFLGREIKFVLDSDINALREKQNKSEEAAGPTAEVKPDLEEVAKNEYRTLVINFIIDRLKKDETLSAEAVEWISFMLIDDVYEIPLQNDIKLVEPDSVTPIGDMVTKLEDEEYEHVLLSNAYNELAKVHKRNMLIALFVERASFRYELEPILTKYGFDEQAVRKQSKKLAKKIINQLNNEGKENEN